MAYTDVWDVTAPLDTQAANQGAADFRATKLDVMQRIASFGAGLLVNRPTPEATSGTADWTGVMYWTTDTKQVFRWSGTAWVDISLDIPSGSASVTKVNDLTTPLVVASGTDVNSITTPITFGAGSIIEVNGSFLITVSGGINVVVPNIDVNGTAIYTISASSGVNPTTINFHVVIIGLDATHYIATATIQTIDSNNQPLTRMYNSGIQVYTPGVGFIVKSRFQSGNGSIQGFGIASYMV